MRKLHIAIILLAALALTACDGMTDGISVNLGPAVFGTAYDATTNQPLSEVRIEVGDRNGLSNQAGSYYVAEVPRGTHTLKATRAGYAAFTAEVVVNETMVEKKVYLTKQ